MAQQNGEAESPVVSLPRRKIASVLDELENERRTIEAVDGEGPRTEELSGYVEEFRNALSVLDESDDKGHVRRIPAAGAADALEEIGRVAIGGNAESILGLSIYLRGALSDDSIENDTEVLTA